MFLLVKSKHAKNKKSCIQSKIILKYVFICAEKTEFSLMYLSIRDEEKHVIYIIIIILLCIYVLYIW